MTEKEFMKIVEKTSVDFVADDPCPEEIAKCALTKEELLKLLNETNRTKNY